jgi:outer membrane protein
MKKLLIALTLLVTSTCTFAQQKIGYIDAEQLITMMPEAQNADAEIKAYAKTYQDKLMAMQKEYETLIKAYEAGTKANTLNEAQKDLKEQEITTLQTSMQTTQQNAEEKVAAKRQDLLKPITDRADKAIQDVAKSKGYTFIFDSSNSGLVYAASDNIMEDVKTALGIKDTPTPKSPSKAPGSTPNKTTPAPKR